MIKKTKYLIITAFSAVCVYNAAAQTTTNSPYSRFGVGELKGTYLPQNRSLGNLAYGISTVGVYNNINIANPASYSQLRLTAFDIGVNVNAQTLKRDNLSENSFNANLGHLAIAVPVSKKSALSFGLLPYSTYGFGYKQQATVSTAQNGEEIIADHVYNGEGGLSRAYLGYGIGLGKNLSVGFNMSYLFGNLKQTNAVEYHNRYVGFFNSKKETNNSVGGLSFDVGAQYIASLSEKMRLTLGYTAGLESKLNNNTSILTTNYFVVNDSEYRVDTVSTFSKEDQKVTLPIGHNFGFSLAKVNNWLVGADFRMADWSNFQMNNVPQNLNKTWGFSVGGQIIPNINSVTNYLALIDYRAGFNYDKTYVQVNNTEIDVKSVNFGMGFPLVAST
ncbi:hypothetical protein EIM50_22660, partial [Pseudoxanthomonas sp. SGD-10]